MRESKCRSCGAMIVWALTTRGKAIPLDAEPVNPSGPGRFVLEGEQARRFEPLLDGGRPTYISHFATCPHAGAHRRRL